MKWLAIRGITLASSALLALNVAIPEAVRAASLVGGLGGPRGYGTTFLGPNDDGSTGEIALPFEIQFFGNTYNSLFLNNNGNITFRSPLSSFTPTAFPGAPQPMIAPYWADVDTRAAGSGVLWYTAPNPNSFIATWDNVGYFGNRDDKLNSFQLILSRDPATDTFGTFTTEFRYEQLQWTTGDFSGGTNGLGGTPAVAGYDDGINANWFALPGSRTGDVLNLTNLSNTGTPGQFKFRFSTGGTPPGSIPSNPLLPYLVDAGFQFEFAVTNPSATTFIDPDIAIGYDYIVNSGPLFDSVTAPTGINADNLFDLYFSGDSCATFSNSQGQITGGVEFLFSTPQRCFSIQGIDVAANLDPADPVAFVTGVSFDSIGTVNITQTPITQFVNPPEGPSEDVPGPLPVFGVFAALGYSRKLRKRIKNNKLSVINSID